jgi:phosphoglycolate phosphatase
LPLRLPSEIAAEDRGAASAHQQTPEASANAVALTADSNRRSALLVDLDGTLTDPAEGIVGCFRLALETLGRIAPPASELHWIIGPPLRGCFAEALGGEGDPEEALQHYRGRYSTTGLFEAVVYDGVKETLAELRAAGMRLFLCTAKPLVYAERILSHFDLEHHFEAAYGDELGGRFQDKADLIAHILEREKLEADDCCMWGDRKHDVLAASRHGIPTIGALWGYGGADELRVAGAATLCVAPLEVPAALHMLPRVWRSGGPLSL